MQMLRLYKNQIKKILDLYPYTNLSKQSILPLFFLFNLVSRRDVEPDIEKIALFGFWELMTFGPKARFLSSCSKFIF